jgi:SIR2-like domain/CHAT domain
VRLRAKGELTALVVVANPSNLADANNPYQVCGRRLAPIDVSGEKGRAETGLRGKNADKPVINSETLVSDPNGPVRVTLDGLCDRLRQGYDVLYLVCHGALITRDGKTQPEPYLCLEDDAGTASLVAGSDLVDRIRDLPSRPRLIVLASCQSSGTAGNPQSDDGGALAALGPSLADEAGIPAVVAMQGNITMETVAKMMPVFFEQLCVDGQIDRALATARGQIRDRRDAWVPVLSMRLRHGRIWHVPGFTSEKGEFDRWNGFCYAIRGDQCSPILGPGLTEALFGSLREVAQRWAEDERFPLTALSHDELPHVAQFMATNQSPGYLRDKFLEHLKTELLRLHGQALSDQQRQASLGEWTTKVWQQLLDRKGMEAYRVLARLPLSIYVSTNPDDLLAAALHAAGKEPVVEICRWKESLNTKESLARFPSIYTEEKTYQPSVKRPLVYHLLGHFREPKSLVLTEDDFFDYLMRVNRPDGPVPSAVESAWSRNALLFLGFHVEDWHFRVLFRSILNEERRYQPKDYNSVAVQINPEDGGLHPEAARRYLEKYFGVPNTVGVFWGNTSSFIETVARKLTFGGHPRVW